MVLNQSPPEKGDSEKRVHFSYVPTSPKAPWHAYTAGPCMWFECHATGKTKACLHEITKGDLLCPRCHEIKPAETTGYLPLFRASDFKPVMVIVHEPSRELVDALHFHRRVQIMRQPGVGEGVQVCHALVETPKFITTDKRKMVPLQPVESLLRIWGYAELIQWYNARAGTNIPVCITRTAKKAVPVKGVPSASEPPAPAGNMGETAQEAIEAMRVRSEAFVQWSKQNKPTE